MSDLSDQLPSEWEVRCRIRGLILHAIRKGWSPLSEQEAYGALDEVVTKFAENSGPEQTDVQVCGFLAHLAEDPDMEESFELLVGAKLLEQVLEVPPPPANLLSLL